MFFELCYMNKIIIRYNTLCSIFYDDVIYHNDMKYILLYLHRYIIVHVLKKYIVVTDVDFVITFQRLLLKILKYHYFNISHPVGIFSLQSKYMKYIFISVYVTLNITRNITY